MILDRRLATRLLLGAGAGSLALGGLHVPRGFARDGDVTRSHGESLMGKLKYPADFAKYDFADPATPRGGTLRIGDNGTFDSFNPFIVKGDPAAGLNIFGGLIYDSLTSAAFDESSTAYGLIAEWMEWPKDYSFVTFKLREEARWHDGRPITAEDAIFSFNALTKFGKPFYRLYWANVEKAEDLGDGLIRFSFDQTDNRELPHIMGQLPILPKHFWAERDFSQSGTDIPLGSGAYRVGKFEVNRFTEYERVGDYWGKDLPVNVGANNFDVIRFEYFKDSNAEFEAFKAGEIDYRTEWSSQNWATRYDFPAFERGDVIREELKLDDPKQVIGLAFNLRREKFQDRRVREALNMMWDFEWTNETVWFDSYARPISYFQDTADLMATGVPEGAELALLREHEADLPPGILERPFENAVSDGSGRIDRRKLRAAKKLLEAAGWKIEQGDLVDGNGEGFGIEFLISNKSQERSIAPFIKNLERLGIKGNIRLVDAAQYVRRVESFDFDMAANGVANSASPGNEQREFWGSDAADAPGSRNLNGVRNPVLDALIDKIIFAEDREALAAASRALDRVALWEHYNILNLYRPYVRVAYWKDRLARPDPVPSQSVAFPTFWWAPEDKG